MNTMRLANGLFVDKENTFGALRFSAMRREEYATDEDGNLLDEVISRTYDLKCEKQGQMIQVKIPADVEEKKFSYNAYVELVNPVLGTVAQVTFMGADIDWYIKADDIIERNGRNNNNFVNKNEKTEKDNK